MIININNILALVSFIDRANPSTAELGARALFTLGFYGLIAIIIVRFVFNLVVKGGQYINNDEDDQDHSIRRFLISPFGRLVVFLIMISLLFVIIISIANLTGNTNLINMVKDALWLIGGPA